MKSGNSTPENIVRAFPFHSAGSSEGPENELRIERWEEGVTRRSSSVGKYDLALTDEPQPTKAWDEGAEPEIVIGEFPDH